MTPSLADKVIEEMPAIMTRVYSKYFSVNEIKQLTAMFKVPIAKKFRELAPDIMRETMQEAQKIYENYMKNHPGTY